MRKLIAFSTAVAVVGVCALLIASTAVAVAAEKSMKAKSETMSGTIDAVNADARTLTLKVKTKAHEVSWSDSTKIAWKHGKAASKEQQEMAAPTAADLKAGEMATVKAEKGADGKLMAEEIWIHPKAMHATSTKTATKK